MKALVNFLTLVCLGFALTLPAQAQEIPRLPDGRPLPACFEGSREFGATYARRMGAHR